MSKNPYKYLTYEGEECVEFETKGKNKYKVIVNKSSWEEYLSDYSWTAIVSKNRVTTKASINKQSQNLWSFIIEHEYDELDYWGSTIDHINNNTLDNRISNLRIFNTAHLNTTNVASKYKENDMQYIHKQESVNFTGYKVHYNLGGETYYKNFSIQEFGTKEKALLEAKKYRDIHVYQDRSTKVESLIKKCRDIEFERGLKNKIMAGEIEEIKEILMKYDLQLTDIMSLK